MADSLTVTPVTGGDQNQATTNSLQSSTEGNLGGTQSENFQPVVSGDTLKSTQGIALAPSALSTVSLSGASTGTTAKPLTAKTQQLNPYLIGGVLLIFVIAAAIFYSISQSGKNYNQY